MLLVFVDVVCTLHCSIYIYNVFSCFCNCMFLSWTCCRNLEHQLKEIRMNQDEMMAGQRGSRISKWIQHSSTMRDRAGWQAPEKIQSLVLVIEMFFFNIVRCLFLKVSC